MGCFLLLCTFNGVSASCQSWGLSELDFAVEFEYVPKRCPLSQEDHIKVKWSEYEKIKELQSELAKAEDDGIKIMKGNELDVAMRKVAAHLKQRVIISAKYGVLFHKLFKHNAKGSIATRHERAIAAAFLKVNPRFSEDGRSKMWKSIKPCKTCATRTLPCTKCAYDAGDCTRC